MDKKYIAPQLSLREAMAAGTFVVLDAFLFLLLVGVPALAVNMFSPTFPWRWKLGNALILAGLLALIAGAVAALIRAH